MEQFIENPDIQKEEILQTQPKQEHIDYLLNNPESFKQFEDVYGEGSSLQYLPTEKQKQNLEQSKVVEKDLNTEPEQQAGVVEDVLKSGVAGIQDAGKETLETIEGLSDSLDESRFGLGGFILGADAENGIIQYLGPKEFIAKKKEIEERDGEDQGLFQSLADIIPEGREAETTAGAVTKGVTQFLGGFLGAKKITSSIQGYNKLNRFIKGSIDGGIADFFVFDEHEARVSDFIIEFVPEAEESFLGYLQADENDTFYEGKLKNVLEGSMLGTVAEGVFRSIKFAKDMRKLKKENNLPKAQKEAKKRSEEIVEDLKDISEEEFEYLAKTNRGIPVELKTKTGRPSRQKVQEDITNKDYTKQIKENFKRVRLGELDFDEAFDIPLNMRTLNGNPLEVENFEDVLVVTKSIFDNVKSLSKEVESVQTFEDIMKQSEEMVETTIDTIKRADNLSKQLLEDGAPLKTSLRIILKGLSRQYINTAKKFNAGLVDQRQVDNIHDLTTKTAELITQLNKGGGRLVNAGNIIIKQESDAIKQVSKLIEQNRFKLSKQELAQLHKKVAQVDEPRTTMKFIKDVVTFRKFGINKINEYWINALLSNPKTHAINMTSNLIVALTRPIEQMVGSGFGLLDRKAFIEAVSTSAGIIKYFQDSLKASRIALKKGDTLLDKGVNKVDLPEQGFGDGVVGKGIRLPSRLLTAEDEFFKQINYRAKAYSMAVSDGLQKGLSKKKNIRLDNGKMVSELDVHIEEFMDGAFKPNGEGAYREALEYAQENTFTKELGKDTLGGLVQTAVNKVPILRQIMPFVRTPINIVRYAHDRTPLGLFKKSVKERLRNPATRSQARGELLLGTSTIVSLATLVGSENITGGYDTNATIRRQQMDSGWQPYSFKIGDKFYSYERLDPFAMIIGITADYMQLHAEMTEDEANQLAEGIQMTMYQQITSSVGNFGQTLINGSMSASKNLTSKTYLKGLSDLIELLDSGEPKKMERFLKQKAGSFAPNIIANFKNDQIFRETKSITDTIKTRLGSEEADPSFNVMGEVRTRDTSFLERFLLPTRVSEMKGDIVLNEFNRLNVGFNPIRDTLGSNQNVQLKNYTNEDGVTAYRRYNEILGTIKVNGRTLREELEKEISGKNWDRLTDNIATDELDYRGSKQDRINRIIKKYRVKAKRILMKENFKSENGLDLKTAIRNDKRNVVNNKKGKDLLDIE